MTKAEHTYAKTKGGHGLGWIKDAPDRRDFAFAVPPEVAAKLPASFSLRDKSPAVYDQLDLGSCTANATCMAYRIELGRVGLPDFQPSRLWHYLEERRIEGDIDDDAGAMPRDGMKVLLHEGVPPESEWPYVVSKFAEQPPAKTYTDDKPHRIASYHAVRRTLTAMKTALYQGHAFTCGIDVFSSFESRAATKTGDIPMPNVAEEDELGGHDILIVGWDDARKVFHFQNSWGSSWADGGFGTIPYKYLMTTALSSDRWVCVIAPPS